MTQTTILTLTSFLMASLLIIDGDVFAQPSLPTAEDIMNRIEAKIDLTEVQLSQIYPIIEEQVAKRNELMQQTSSQGRSTQQAMRNKMEEINKETESELAGYMTAEQLEQWKKLQGELLSKRAGREVQGAIKAVADPEELVAGGGDQSK